MEIGCSQLTSAPKYRMSRVVLGRHSDDLNAESESRDTDTGSTKNSGGFNGENSCRRIVGDAGEGWGQALLWNRRRRTESRGGRTAPKWRNRVCSRSS